MRFSIVSLFSEYFDGPLSTSMMLHAREKGIVAVDCVSIRDFATDKHKSVDDRPFGGGPGMVLMPGPVVSAVRSVGTPESLVVFLSPQGERLTSTMCEVLGSEEKHIVLLSGHYEGVDQRALDILAEEFRFREVSVGDFILPSGMPATLCVIEAVARFVPGFIGNPEGVRDETFHTDSGFEGPLYTRPVTFEGRGVPEVLLSGHAAKIKQWRNDSGRAKMKTRRGEHGSICPKNS